MTNRELEIFMTVAECGKMSEAAKKLFITQSSVSQAISSIESKNHIRLFERLSNGLHITEEGRQLLSFSRNLFAVRKELSDFLSDASRIHRLRIGATVTVGTCVLNPIVSQLRQEYPGIRLNVEVANTHVLEDLLLKNEIDIGLVEGIVNSHDLVSRAVIPDMLVLICAPNHPLSEKAEVCAADLREEEFILREQGSGTRALFEDQMKALGIPLHVTWSCCNSEAIRNAVAAGNGISVISRRLVEQDALSGRLRMCDITGIEMRRHFSVVFHKDKHLTPELSSFILACEAFENCSLEGDIV